MTTDTSVSIVPAIPPGPAVPEFGTLTRICVQYSAADLFAIGGDPLLLTIAYYDTVEGDWVTLDTDVNAVGGFACAWTSHASTWAILTESGCGGGGLPLGAWIGIGFGGFILIVLVLLWARRFRY